MTLIHLKVLLSNSAYVFIMLRVVIVWSNKYDALNALFVILGRKLFHTSAP